MLVAPVNSPPATVGGGVRETVICYARVHLGGNLHYESDMTRDSMWNYVSSTLMTCVSTLMMERPAAGRDESEWTFALVDESCRRLRGYLDEAIWSAFALSLIIEQKTTASVPARKRWYQLLQLHCVRQGNAARAADIEPADIRDTLAGYADDRIREYDTRKVSGGLGRFA